MNGWGNYGDAETLNVLRHKKSGRGKFASLGPNFQREAEQPEVTPHLDSAIIVSFPTPSVAAQFQRGRVDVDRSLAFHDRPGGEAFRSALPLSGIQGKAPAMVAADERFAADLKLAKERALVRATPLKGAPALGSPWHRPGKGGHFGVELVGALCGREGWKLMADSAYGSMAEDIGCKAWETRV